ncbi:MAG: hypothetical protein V5A57_03605 [Candidatus Paceibacterota bacterium]
MNLIYLVIFYRMGIINLLVWNPCFLVESLAVLALIKKDPKIEKLSVISLMIVGFTGLFILEWNGLLLKGQFDHLLMIGTAIYLIRSKTINKSFAIRGVWLAALTVVIFNYVLVF